MKNLDARTVMRWAMALFYAAAGIIHLRTPELFLPIVPSWVPSPRGVVIATGWCELAGAAGLFLPRLRRAAGIGLALYAICVFPANIHHALIDAPVGGTHLGWWYHAPRFALQPVLVWWALYCSGVTDWPWRK
jgi:uncharacterized membrane protein